MNKGGSQGSPTLCSNSTCVCPLRFQRTTDVFIFIPETNPQANRLTQQGAIESLEYYLAQARDDQSVSEMGDFDPYYLWLQISPSERPPSLYRLLGLTDFESDPEVIDNATEQRLMHLRKFQDGSNGQLAEALITEVSQARLALLNPDSRTDYDKLLEQNLERKQVSVATTSTTAEISASAKPLITTSATNKRLSYTRGRKKSAWQSVFWFIVVIGFIAGATIYFVNQYDAKSGESNGNHSESNSTKEKSSTK